MSFPQITIHPFMKEKFNAAKHLKDFDPTRHVDPRIVPDFMDDLPYSQAEWDEYRAFKNSFESLEEWLTKRSDKHRMMARDYALAREEAEKKLK